MIEASLLTLALMAAAPPDLTLETVVVTADAVKVTVANHGGPSYGCYLELALFDNETGKQTTTRQQTVKPLRDGGRQTFVFPAEASFANQRFQLEVDSSHRIGESDELNNVSAKIDAPVAKAGPIRIPGKTSSDNRRPPPIRIGGDTEPATAKDPVAPKDLVAPKEPPPPKDPAQRGVDLVAVSITDNGVEAVGTIRNDSGVTFKGHRTARMTREVKESVHIMERKDYGKVAIPTLAPGEEWRFTTPSLPKRKGAEAYVMRLFLEPRDDYDENDVAEKTVKVVKID
jgi:CARDB